MATLFAKNSHSWSARASNNWTLTKGGTDYQTPASGDVLLANGLTITVDADLTASQIRNDTTSGATGGGQFTCATNGLTITANIFAGTTTTACFAFTAASGNSITIIGTVTGGSSATLSYGVTNTSTGTVNIGSVGTPATISGGTGAATSYGVQNASTGIINVIGNVQGGSGAATAYGINNASTGTINITGNILGGSGTTTAHGVSMTGGGTLNVLGTAQVQGGSSATTGVCHGVNGLTGTVTIGTQAVPGAVIGGTGATTCYGVTMSTGSVVVWGTVSGGSGALLCYGLYMSGAGQATVTGTMTATSTAPAVAGVSTALPMRLQGAMVGHVSGVQAVFDQKWSYNAASLPASSSIVVSIDGSSKTSTFIPTGAAYPAEADVRYGTSFASGTMTGSCRIPAAQSVAYGVPVDATTGSAMLTAAAVADAVMDETITDHTIVGSLGRFIAAAGDPWLTLVPGEYADGTAAAALGRLNLTAPTAPVIVDPDPADDSTLGTVYVYTEAITGAKVAGITIHIQLVTTPAKSSRVLLAQAVTATTDANGYAATSLRRNASISPAGSKYLVTCDELGFSAVELDLAADLFNLASLIP